MKIKTCGIYKITSITGCIYIGQSVNIHSRWNNHKKHLGKNQPKLHSSLKKHGIENHTFEIIEECSRELLNEREIYWIKHFDSFDTPHGMNLKIGGEQIVFSGETRRLMSKAQKGKIHPEERNKKIGDSHRGKKKPPVTIETKKKISNTLKSRTRSEAEIERSKKSPSEETKKKISNSLKGRPPSEETCKKISATLKGVQKSPEAIAKSTKTRKEKRELTQHIIQSIVFRHQILDTVNFHSIFKKGKK